MTLQKGFLLVILALIHTVVFACPKCDKQKHDHKKAQAEADDHSHDHDGEEPIIRIAHPADFNTDYNKDNLHQKYKDVEEEEEMDFEEDDLEVLPDGW